MEMLFSPPYGYGSHRHSAVRAPHRSVRPQHQSSAQYPSLRSEPEPLVNTSTKKSEYSLTIAPPEGFKLADTGASLEGRKLQLEGSLAQLPRPDTHEYITRARVVMYDRPSVRYARPIEILPRASVVRGSEPTESGWIALVDGGFLLDDGSLQLVSRARPRLASRFQKLFELPEDADLSGAVSDPSEDGSSWVISVPRLRPARPVKVRVQPEAPAPAMPAPEPAHFRPKATARPEASSTAKSRPTTAPPAATSKWAAAPSAPVSMDCQAMQSPARAPPTVRAQRQVQPPSPAAAPPAAKRRAAPSSSATSSKAQCSADGLGVISSEPLLQELSCRAANVQRPPEVCEEWVATPDGGFALIGC